jgi:hypothetical protein
VIQEWIVGEGKSIDDVNARLHANCNQLDMVGVVDGVATIHRRLLRLLDKMDEHQLASHGDYGWSEKGELSGFYYTPHGIKLSFSVVEKSSTCALVRYMILPCMISSTRQRFGSDD